MKNPISWLARNIRETRELDRAVASLYQMMDANLAGKAQRDALHDVFSLLDDPDVDESVKSRIEQAGLSGIGVAYTDVSGNLRVRGVVDDRSNGGKQ